MAPHRSHKGQGQTPFRRIVFVIWPRREREKERLRVRREREREGERGERRREERGGERREEERGERREREESYALYSCARAVTFIGPISGREENYSWVSGYKNPVCKFSLSQVLSCYMLSVLTMSWGPRGSIPRIHFALSLGLILN